MCNFPKGTSGKETRINSLNSHERSLWCVIMMCAQGIHAVTLKGCHCAGTQWLVQLLSRLCDPMDCNLPGFAILHCPLEFAVTHVRWVGDAIQASHPLSPPSSAFNLSQPQGLFQWVGSSYQVAKVLEFQLQHQSFQWMNTQDWLISFRMDWLDLLVVQGTLKSLLQHHSSKASILQHSAFSMVQLSHPYMTILLTE